MKEIKLWIEVLDVVQRDTFESNPDTFLAACDMSQALQVLEGEVEFGLITESEVNKILTQYKIRIEQLINK